MSLASADPRLHVLFLNTQDALRADVSVHVSLARALDRRHVRVSAATSRYEAAGDSARAAFEAIPNMALQLVHLGRPLARQRGFGRLVAVLHNVRASATLLGLALWCRRERVDVIHVTERPRDALFGLLLARLGGAACVIHSHTSYYPHGGSPTAHLSDWLLRHADAVVGVSQFTAGTLVRNAKVQASRVRTVHNAVDTTVLNSQLPPDARSEMRQRLGIPMDVPVLASVGRLMDAKDQASLVEAFATVRKTAAEARLVIAGQSTDAAPDGRGTYQDYLVRRVEELGLRDSVIFTGLLPHELLPRLYAALDVFVHPCVEEPFGLVLVEAMARFLPVVAVNAGGVPEIICDGTSGLLVPPRQPIALADAILRVLCQPALAERLARSGHERVVAAFTPEAQAATMLNVYRQIAHCRPQPGPDGVVCWVRS